MSSFVGAIAVADLVKTTLGPKGMDKILQSQSGAVTFTNDGATILKQIPIDNPAAKIIVDTSKTQDSEIGDGTTSVAVLAGELLREAEKLITIMKIHPQTVVRGWRKALVAARAALEGAAVDNVADAAKFRNDLVNIARTTLSSKILSSEKDFFANLAVDAVLRMKGSVDLGNIHIIKKIGGNMRDSFLDTGFILDKKIGVGQPKRIENARILVSNTSLDSDKIKIYGAKIKVDNVNEMATIEEEEKKKMKEKVQKILKHDINIFIDRQLIYNYPEQLFADAGVMAIEHADFEGVERLAKVLDAEIASTFDQPGRVKVGRCDLVEEIVIGEDKVIRFSGVAKGEACTVVLRGASKQILDEAERSLHDALCILVSTTQHTRTVLGGGCSEMLMAQAVEELAKQTAGKEALAMEGFANALRAIPAILSDNAGLDSTELVAQMRKLHYEGRHSVGLDVERGCVGDMVELRITESYRAKSQVVISAHEAAEMIVRVDEIIRTAPRQREQDHRHH